MERDELIKLLDYPEKQAIVTINFKSGKNYTGKIYYISQSNSKKNCLVYLVDSYDPSKMISFDSSQIESIMIPENLFKEVGK